MMGRSSSTSDTDFNIVEEQSLMSEYSGDGTGQSLSMIESTRAFLIMERTINKVYTKRMVSLGLLQSLAREVQEKSSMLPKSLRVTASPKAQETPSLSTQQFNLRNTHVSCSYYFAMMLLSRPFLITALRAKSLPHFTENPRSGSTNDGKGNDISSEINDGAVTCIDSAIAWTFVAVLVLSSAHFGRLDLQRPIEQTLHQADNILSCFAVNSPQARRYHLILKKLSKAAEEHWNQTNQKKPQSRTPYMPRLFQISPGNSEFTSNSFITESQAKEAVGDGRFLGNEDPCRVSSSVQAASSSPYTTPLLGQAVGPREHEALNDCLRLGNSTLFSDYNENSPGFELRGHEMTTTSGLSGDEPFSGFGDGATIWDFSWAGSL
ncbi:hypothetical protein PHISCL_01789 [Aspergillus sclerotialis]|uniref:Uncharacterized protein n=1 Tax=Aspergillus sclerotialis TaxID=2070753 RepID=A0A3A2ZRT8_9EURO|nr:hypothetical protein PHISCL_01789 [Aspergillus sclerotialis]